MNGEYIRALPVSEFNELVRPHVVLALSREVTGDEWDRFEMIAPLVQERTKLLPDAGEQVVFLFEDIEQYDEQSWSKVMTKEGVVETLDEAYGRLEALDEWVLVSIESTLREMPAALGIAAAKTFQPIRVAITGSSISPPLFESIAAIGKNVALDRLEAARLKLG
jgi:glutamyl-tRNA synthetase